MTSKISNAPSARTFAEAYRKEVLEPAATRIDDGSGNVDARAALTGADTLLQGAVASAAGQDVASFVAAQAQAAKNAVAAAAGSDGRLSKADAQSLPTDMRLAYHFLRTGQLPATALPAAPRANYSTNVMNDVLASYGLSDEAALVQKALELGDGNGYLNRTELEAAAADLRSQAVNLSTFDWSDNVVQNVLTGHNLGDRGALLREATKFDADGNRYLKRSELEAAAKSLTGGHTGLEIGIISDIDKTLLPPNRPQGNLPPPYPGIVQMLVELEGPQSGDVHYVTARNPSSVANDNVRSWMSSAGLPTGTLDTGVSPLPWVARAEKVNDISVHFDATTAQNFVLFGDNSHADHLAYSDIIAKYPGRVKMAFIHNVKIRNFTPPAGMMMIDNYADAAAKLLELDVLNAPAARRIMVAAQAEGLTITDAEIDALITAASS